MKTKFAIGCLVQWYEVDIIEEYIETLKEAIDEYDGEVIVEFCVVEHEILENCITPEKKQECLRLIEEKLLTLNHLKTTIWSGQVMYSIADYRRQFNEKYCEQADVLVWGESDMLVPKQTFNILDNLHQMSLQNNNPKYLAFFGTCKMWDQSWEMLEHPDFTIKPHIDNDYDNWWSLKYTMTKEEMNKINEKTEDLEVLIAPQHKFNGCGLVISSEVVKSGVNIPKSVFFVHEDTAFMHMTNKILGNIPQYIIKNILLVHNRNHPKKRRYIKNEKEDCYNIFNPNYKSLTWNDVWK